MNLCRDKQIKGFLLFLISFALLLVGTETVLAIYQVNDVEVLWLTHNEAVVSSLLEQGVSKEAIVTALIILFLSFSVTVEFMQHTLTPLQPWTADLSIISPDNSCAIDKALLDDLKENPVVDLAYGRKFAYEVSSVTNGIEKKMDLISYEQYQFDWAKDYLLEGSLESVQTDVWTGLIVYDPQNTIQIGDTVSLNINGRSKEIQIVGMLSDCPFYSAAGVGTIICSEDTFEQITGESKYTIIDVQLAKGTTDEDVYEIRQTVDSSFTFADERMGNSSTMGTYYCFWLFIYGFLVLIALILSFFLFQSTAQKDNLPD